VVFNYCWKKDQDVEEELYIASEAIEYQKKLANPSGWGANACFQQNNDAVPDHQKP